MPGSCSTSARDPLVITVVAVLVGGIRLLVRGVGDVSEYSGSDV
jgi:hypothetical protein